MIKRDKGFTLIEILVSLVLAGIVLSTIFSLYQFERNLIKKQEKIFQVQEQVRLTYNRILDTIKLYPNISVHNSTISSYLEDETGSIKILNFDGISKDALLNYIVDSNSKRLTDNSGNIIVDNLFELNIKVISPQVIRIVVISKNIETNYEFKIDTIFNLRKL